MGKQLLRSLSFRVSLCIWSIILPLAHAVSAPWQIEHNASITPPTIVQVIPMTLPSQIFRRWTHSREEDVGDTLVYRPSDYPFPPARGREGLEFRENGEFIRYQIGSTDRSLATPGRWSVQETNKVKVQFPNQSASLQTLTILECDEQILKVRQTAEVTASDTQHK
ncbi:hypothetical protein [Allocoleopsis sp.]|uniref:hypothetical protein n=1 Tax=Allocoleopsis sp. TaxID=3088169 RepID=UPI002FCFE1F4